MEDTAWQVFSIVFSANSKKAYYEEDYIYYACSRLDG